MGCSRCYFILMPTRKPADKIQMDEMALTLLEQVVRENLGRGTTPAAVVAEMVQVIDAWEDPGYWNLPLSVTKTQKRGILAQVSAWQPSYDPNDAPPTGVS